MTWTERATAIKAETHDALKLLWDELNHGQQMKLLKNAEIEKLLLRFGVIEDADG